MPIDPRVVLVNTADWTLRGSRAHPCHVPHDRLPVAVTARFRDGTVAVVPGTASAWTDQAVDVLFQHPDPALRGGGYRVWIPVADVTSDLSVLPDPPADIGSDN